MNRLWGSSSPQYRPSYAKMPHTPMTIPTWQSKWLHELKSKVSGWMSGSDANVPGQSQDQHLKDLSTRDFSSYQYNRPQQATTSQPIYFGDFGRMETTSGFPEYRSSYGINNNDVEDTDEDNTSFTSVRDVASNASTASATSFAAVDSNEIAASNESAASNEIAAFNKIPAPNEIAASNEVTASNEMPSTSGMSVFAAVKQEMDEDMIDVDGQGKPMSMIRVPKHQWDKLLEFQNKLETLKQESAAVDNSAPKSSARINKQKKKKSSRAGPPKGTEAPPPNNGSRKSVRLSAAGSKSHECSVCNKTFAHNGGLVNHQMRHTDPSGLLVCGVCKRSDFKTGHHLRQHEVTHFPVFPCKYCGKKYGTPRIVRTHQRCNKRCAAAAAAMASQ